jgi:hypothetical protein
VRRRVGWRGIAWSGVGWRDVTWSGCVANKHERSKGQKPAHGTQARRGSRGCKECGRGALGGQAIAALGTSMRGLRGVVYGLNLKTRTAEDV